MAKASSTARGQLPWDPDRAARELARGDETLARLIERVGPLRLARRYAGDPFQALLRAIVYQQLSGRAAARIHERVLALGERPGRLGAEELLRIPEERLRAAGLSRAKTLAVRDLAQRRVAGLVPSARRLRGMSDGEVLEALTGVRGIGRWTVEMLLIFGLGRPDVFPCTDLGVRKGYRWAWGLPELPAPRLLDRAAERWRPWRSAAAWYLWRASELETGASGGGGWDPPGGQTRPPVTGAREGRPPGPRGRAPPGGHSLP